MLQRSRKSTWRRSALLVTAVILAMTVLSACGKKNEEHSLTFDGAGEGTVVATYKDGNVTEAEFNKYLGVFNVMQPGYESILEIPQFKEQLLQQFVSYKIIGQQASKETLEAASKQVDEQMKLYKETVEKDAKLKSALDQYKVTDKDIATYVYMTAAVVEHMTSQVTEEGMQAEFEATKDDYTNVTARHILVATVDMASEEMKELRTAEEALARANEVKAKLEAGGDWTELAAQYSDDGGSKANGGLYENKPAGGWVEGFKDAALTQEIGAIGEPVETEYGYHVIKVEKREPKAYDALTETEKENIESTVAYSFMTKFMNEEMPKMNVEITLPEAPVEEGAEGTEGETPATDAPASEAPAATEAPTK